MNILSLIIILLLNASGYAQPFLGFQATNKGVGAQLGVLESGIEVTMAYRSSLINNDRPAILSLTVGRQILLTRNDEDNYTITPHAGYANYRIKDYSAYDIDPNSATGPTQISELRPILAVELGKDAYMGRVFISATWCKSVAFGVGFKMFPYRK